MKCKRGFSLVDIIASIALLGVLSAAFLPIFLTGLEQVVRSGNKRAAYFDAQTDADRLLAGSSVSSALKQNVTADINFSGTALPMNGTLYTIEVEIPGSGGETTKMRIFLPEK